MLLRVCRDGLCGDLVKKKLYCTNDQWWIQLFLVHFKIWRKSSEVWLSMNAFVLHSLVLTQIKNFNIFLVFFNFSCGHTTLTQEQIPITHFRNCIKLVKNMLIPNNFQASNLSPWTLLCMMHLSMSSALPCSSRFFSFPQYIIPASAINIP